VAGSPTDYGHMAAELKKFIDDSMKFHGKLSGKVGGAFASSANVGGGNETTVRSILDAWLIHGMIVEGTAHGDHYGFRSQVPAKQPLCAATFQFLIYGAPCDVARPGWLPYASRTSSGAWPAPACGGDRRCISCGWPRTPH